MSHTLKTSCSSNLNERKKTQGALRQHSVQKRSESSEEGENNEEYVRHKSLPYHTRKKGIARYLPFKKVRPSAEDIDTCSWDLKPVISSFLDSIEGLDAGETTPSKLQLKTQLTELEAIAIISVFEHIELMIGILDPGNPNELDDLNILYYSTPTERFYMKPIDLPLICGQDVLVGEADRRECKKILKILHEGINELQWFGSYSIFRTAILIPHIVKADETQLVIDLQENLEKIIELRNSIKSYYRDRRRRKTLISTEQEKKQGCLKKQSFYQKRDIRYLELWNKSREEQHTYNLNRIETNLKKKCEDLEMKVKLAVYANNNAMLFLRMNMKALRRKKNYFDKRLKEDGENLDNTISEMQGDLEDLKQTILKAQHHYETIKKKYDKVKARKQKIIEEERRFRVQEKAAKKIQRWWRQKLLEKSSKDKKGKKGKKGKK